MNKFTITFVRKDPDCNQILANAVIQCESLFPYNQDSVIHGIKLSVNQWCDTTKAGKAVLNYAGGEPNIGDVAESLDNDPVLKKLLTEGSNIDIKSISVNEQTVVDAILSVDYDTSLYCKSLSEVVCSHCECDLTQRDSVTREYINKDGGDSAYCDGAYKLDSGDFHFHFEPSSDIDLSHGRYDLLDDSDKCAACDNQL